MTLTTRKGSNNMQVVHAMELLSGYGLRHILIPPMQPSPTSRAPTCRCQAASSAQATPRVLPSTQATLSTSTQAPSTRNGAVSSRGGIQHGMPGHLQYALGVWMLLFSTRSACHARCCEGVCSPRNFAWHLLRKAAFCLRASTQLARTVCLYQGSRGLHLLVQPLSEQRRHLSIQHRQPGDSCQ
jgi:hypothetical protein